MELEEFIGKTLISIHKGVKQANKEANNSYMVEPVSWHKDRADGCIKFDIAVTASQESGKKGGAGIKVWSVGISGEKETTKLDQVVSRIKFNVAPQSAIS